VVKYDPTRTALYRPGDATEFFLSQAAPSPAALCAEVSRLAYCESRTRVERELARAGFSVIESFDKRGTQAILVADKDRAVLAFRGTEGDDPTDIISDALFLPEDWAPGGKVHKGFAKALEFVWPAIAKQLKSLAGQVLFTGHSLGAALATLAASRHPDAGLYTFGSPRVGDGDFGDSLAQVDAHRFVNCCDLVCRVPPRPYRHVGALHYIDREGNISLDPDDSAMADDRSRAREDYLVRYAWRNRNILVRDLADHAPVNYVYALVGEVG
jgi:pimeloyl-ACP methyl ester carboxylesterase